MTDGRWPILWDSMVIGHRSSVIGHRSSVIGHRSSAIPGNHPNHQKSGRAFAGAPAMPRKHLYVVAILCTFAFAGRPASAGERDVRLNQIQVIGTHKSYHRAPEGGVMKVIAPVRPT